MNNDNDDKFRDEEEQLEFRTPENDDSTSPWERKDPQLGDFDDDYEEPDRDTNYAAAYTEVEQDDLDDYQGENKVEFEEGDYQEEETTAETLDLWSDGPDTTEIEFEVATDDEANAEIFEEEEEEEEGSEWSAVIASQETAPFLAEQTDSAWGDPVENTHEEDYFEDNHEVETNWPMGLIFVAVVALILLGAGGYGVMKERAAMEEEIRQLQGRLATTAKSENTGGATHAALADAEQSNRELQASIDNLTLENRSLSDTVAGLESQLKAQQDALTKSAPVVKAAKPVPALAPKAQAPASSSAWFVNFGSYSQRETAESWTRRLKPGTGKVAVSAGTRDGKTFYRVRVVNLANRESAERVARQLEKEYGLTKLWVGQQ